MTFIRPGIVAGSFALPFAGGCQSSPAEAADEKPITIGTSSVPAGLDPAGVYDAGSWAVFTNICQNLLTFEPGSPTPKPDAAESCAFTSAALTTYRCELRDGLTFSNGNPLTATAVERSFERILRIRDPLGPGPLFANLLSVDAKGSLVTFHLATADATWPYPEADPVYAAERLRSAGVTTPVRIRPGHQTGIAAVEARELKEQWDKDGLFRVELVEERDFTTYQKRGLKSEFDVHLYQWIPDFPDADTFVQPLVGTGNVLGNGYTSAEVDHAIRDTQRFTDRGKAMQRFRAVQDTIAKDAPLIPVWHRQRQVVTRSTVLGGHLLAEDAI